jgi:hypothetical protein
MYVCMYVCIFPTPRYLLHADEGPSLETSKFSIYYSGSCNTANESLHTFNLKHSDYIYANQVNFNSQRSQAQN